MHAFKESDMLWFRLMVALSHRLRNEDMATILASEASEACIFVFFRIGEKNKTSNTNPDQKELNSLFNSDYICSNAHTHASSTTTS